MTNVEPSPHAREKRDSLEEAYLTHVPAAVRLAFVLTGDREAAEDLVHDAFVRVAGRFAHVRRREAFGGYLRRTVVNLHLSRLRRLKLERAHLERLGSARRSNEAMPDVAEHVDLWRTLQRLPPRQRAAVALRYYEDLSERETADVLGCTVAAAKSLVSRGLRALSTAVQGGEER